MLLPTPAKVDSTEKKMSEPEEQLSSESYEVGYSTASDPNLMTPMPPQGGGGGGKSRT